MGYYSFGSGNASATPAVHPGTLSLLGLPPFLDTAPAAGSVRRPAGFTSLEQTPAEPALQEARWRVVQRPAPRVLRLLAQPSITANIAAKLFAGAALAVTFADSETYAQLAAGTLACFGEPGRYPAFIDCGEDRIVLDTARCFDADSERLSPAGIMGLTAALGHPAFTRQLRESLVNVQARNRVPGDADPAEGEAERLQQQFRQTMLAVVEATLWQTDLNRTPPLARAVAQRIGQTEMAQAYLNAVPAQLKQAAAAFLEVQRPA